MFGEKVPDTYVIPEVDESQVREEYQKWNHINLSDFRSSSCWHIASYIWLWWLTIIAVGVYAADTYTAVILIAFNRWPGQIKPAIPFDISRWIFTICILFSWVLLGYQYVRAFRVLRRNSVAKDYLDPTAAQYQSLRSWRRFLVFAQLTESKKGADYVALFTYFQFKGAVRILIAQGPRQAINAITLYAFMQQSILPNGGDSSANRFFGNIRELAQTQHEHAVIIFTMLFTLTIWVFSMLSLIAAALCYCGFLWHYVGKNLTRYCKKKIEKRLRKIVSTAIEKEMLRQEKLRQRAATKRPGLWSRSNSSNSTFLHSRPTLPDLGDHSDAVSISTTVTRNGSSASSSSQSLPQQPQQARFGKPSKQKLARQPTLPCIDERSHPGTPTRQHSNSSISSSDSADNDGHRPLLHHYPTAQTGSSGTWTGVRTQSSETLPSHGIVRQNSRQDEELHFADPFPSNNHERKHSYDSGHMYPAPLSVARKPVPGAAMGRYRAPEGTMPVSAPRGVYGGQASGQRRGSQQGWQQGRQGSGSRGPQTFEAMGVR